MQSMRRYCETRKALMQVPCSQGKRGLQLLFPEKRVLLLFMVGNRGLHGFSIA